MMRVGIISGSGNYTWPRLTDARPQTVQTSWGAVDATLGRVAGVEVVHISRHGAGHARLSNHVEHRANLACLLDLAVDCVVSLTVCGAVDGSVPLGSLIAFDDLYFPSNRLPDGTLCTWYDAVGGTGRGHWIFDTPVSEPLRRQLCDAARDIGVPLVDRGCYGHVDGPRFNSRTEIAALGSHGVTAVSQTAGPEMVLAGEAELPLAVLGFVTDHATGVPDEPQPVEELLRLMRTSAETFARVLDSALPRLTPPTPAGIVYRFEHREGP